MIRVWPDATEMAPADAVRGVRDGRVHLIDVRREDERRELAPGVPSQHLPVEELCGRIDELPATQRLAFVCRTGRRSAEATEAATAAGLDARNVTGGMVAWVEAHLPTTKDPA